MPQSSSDTFSIQRRSSAHSAYWMSNALVPAGLIMMYKYGWGLESFLGLVFIAIGATGYAIYKQKMRVPLVTFDGEYLTYRPSASNPGRIKMDNTALFKVHQLGLTAETIGRPDSKIEISLLDFNSNDDWQRLLDHLQREPDIRLVFD